MADQKDKDVKIEAPDGAEAKPAKKKSKLPLIVIIVVGAIVAFLAADFLALHMFIFKKAAKPAAGAAASSGTAAAPGQPKKMGKFFKLDPFIVNLADPGGRRYLKLEAVLEFDKEKMMEELNQRKAQIRSDVILLLTSKTFAEIAPMSGKIKLKDEIMRAVNKHLTAGKVYSIHFTDFVIQ